MTLEEFKANHNWAPYELYEFAELAADVTDCPEIYEAGKAYLLARRRMLTTLTKYDIEVG